MYKKSSFIPGLMLIKTFTIAFVIFLTINNAYAEDKMGLTLKSTAFTHGSAIPSKYTCEGENLSPPLNWEGVPENTRSLVLIVDDPDAPDPKAPRMTWVHWVLYNMPRETSGLSEGIIAKALPIGTGEGLNDSKEVGYDGPCPPIGRHRYFHKLYALDTVLKGLNKPTKAQVEEAMKGHIVAKTELIGTYEKQR